MFLNVSGCLKITDESLVSTIESSSGRADGECRTFGWGGEGFLGGGGRNRSYENGRGRHCCDVRECVRAERSETGESWPRSFKGEEVEVGKKEEEPGTRN